MKQTLSPCRLPRPRGLVRLLDREARVASADTAEVPVGAVGPPRRLGPRDGSLPDREGRPRRLAAGARVGPLRLGRQGHLRRSHLAGHRGRALPRADAVFVTEARYRSPRRGGASSACAAGHRGRRPAGGGRAGRTSTWSCTTATRAKSSACSPRPCRRTTSSAGPCPASAITTGGAASATSSTSAVRASTCPATPTARQR